jgi:hypothetical protein
MVSVHAQACYRERFGNLNEKHNRGFGNDCFRRVNIRSRLPSLNNYNSLIDTY